ncbi:hypothetical protein [uncultured Ruminococcus sp.]|uniref:hypothetical protein n=1 Tax=uncultured Ruminococcus sp. TaxID=165186 RepID=UPI0025D02C46|nr:hypothetical protein [uncultured Ruminococcus sp.]
MTDFSRKFIPKCIIWCIGGGFVLALILVVFMMPVANYMSTNRDPSPLLPTTVAMEAVVCLYYTASAFICLGKVMAECTELPVNPKKWFVLFTLIQLAMRVKEAVSKYFNYKMIYDRSMKTLSSLGDTSEVTATEDYLRSYYAAYNKGVVLMLIVGLILTAASYFVLYGRYKALAERRAQIIDN